MMDSYRVHLLRFADAFSSTAVTCFDAKKLARMPKPDGVVITGMGGSGLPGVVIEALAKNLRLPPVVVAHDASLPPHPFSRPLFIFVSFSGATKETIAAFHEARKRGARVAVVSTGGTLWHLTIRKRLPRATFAAGDLTPREAVGYTYHAVLELLSSLFPIPSSAFLERRLHPRRFEEKAKSLARKLVNTIPVIYTDTSFRHVGYAWKTNLNETAKQPAFANLLPEAFHNEITGFEKGGNKLFPLFLVEPGMLHSLQKKIARVQALLARHGIKSERVTLDGKNKIEATWNGILLSHFTSYFLAKLNRVDPRATHFIDQLKTT